jgi:hypothetical protein
MITASPPPVPTEPTLRDLQTEQLRRLYRTAPAAYAEDVLRVHLTAEQEEMLASIVANRRTACRASHSIGKTFLAAVAACWWYDCWDDSIVYVTAPNWSQTLGLTFKEIKRMRRSLSLPGVILDTGLVRDADPIRAASHYIKAINSDKSEGFTGEHSAPILLIFEESCGVQAYVWEASDGLMTAETCRIFAIGNPTDEASPFGLACASPLYNTVSVSALNHPNILAELEGKPPPFPGNSIGLVWLREMIEKECEEIDTLTAEAFEFPPASGKVYLPNAVFEGRVLGQFPTQASEQVIPRGWLTNCTSIVQPADAPVEIGCDVARHGADRTTIAVRHGSALITLRELRQMDVDVVAGALVNMAQQAGKDFQVEARTIPIKIDVTGGLGVGPSVMVRNAGYNAVEVNSSKSASSKSTYPNVRSELWFTLREYARERKLDLSLLPKRERDALLRELSTPKWAPDSKGRKVVEPKDAIKKRLGESPDLGDAVCLSFHSPRRGVARNVSSATSALLRFDFV